MDGTPMLTEVAADPPGTEVGHLRPDDGKQRLDIFARTGRETGQGSEAVSSPSPPPCWSSAAVPVAERDPTQPDREVAAKEHRPAPSPNTVVVASGHRARKTREQARAQEAVLRAEYAAEIARLTRLLRETRRAHAAELDRLRAEHAAKLRRVIEAQWRARDAVRATGKPGNPAKNAAHAPQAQPPGARLILPEWLARLVGKN